MEDHENHGNVPPGPNKGSPECHCVKSNATNPNPNPNPNNNTSSNDNGNGNGIGNSNGNSNNKEQDRFLPIANVGRIMKKVIPSNGKISKDAKETVQECVSEFISFVTGEASDKCQKEKRKTINGDDIIWAITTLGFEEYVAPLKLYLNKYREIEGEKLNVPKQQRSSSSDQQQQPKQPQPLQRQPSDHLQHHQHDHHQHVHQQNLPSFNNTSSVYSSTTLLSHHHHPHHHHHHHHHHPSFVPSDHHQPFSLPFSSNSIQKQLQQQDQIDSVGHW